MPRPSNITNGDDITINFLGRQESEDDFAQEFNLVMDRLSESKSDLILYRILWEIVRNIYDHNGGWGYLKLRQMNDYLEFEIANTKPTNPTETLLDSGPNFGIGLGTETQPSMIFGYAKEIALELSLDVSSGYLFKGRMKRPTND